MACHQVANCYLIATCSVVSNCKGDGGPELTGRSLHTHHRLESADEVGTADKVY